MAFVFTVTPGTQLAPGELLDNDKANLLGQPTISMSGSLADVLNVSTTAPADGDFLVWVAGTGKWTPGGTLMTGATPSANGKKGLVPQPLAGDNTKFLRGDATWGVLDAGQQLYNFFNLY